MNQAPRRRLAPVALAILGAALVVGLALFLLREPPQRGVQLGSEDAIAREADTPGREPARAGARDEPTRGSGDPAAAERGAPGTETESAAPQRVAQSRGTLSRVTILVRRAGEEAPIPGAELLCFEDLETSEHELEALIFGRGFDGTAFGRLAIRAHADDQGRAEIACVPGKLVVLAIGDDYFGMDGAAVAAPSAAGAAEPASVVVDCKRTSSLRVQVVDASGRPCPGVRVLAEKVRREMFELSNVSAVTVGAEATAVLRPLADPESSWSVSIDGLYPRAEAVLVDLASPPPQPIRLVLSEHGAVEVRIAHADGLPYLGSVRVELTPLDEPATAAVTSGSGREFAAAQQPALMQRIELGAGRTRFEHVGLGRRLRARLDFGIPGDAPSLREFDGPTTPGEVVEIDLAVDPAFPTLVGRLLDPEGRPLRHAGFELRLAYEGPVTDPEAALGVATDAVGRFGVRLYQRVQHPLRTLAFARTRDDRAPLGAFRAFELVPGTNDLGDWRLAPPELLASGTTIGLVGEPVGSRSVEFVDPERRPSLGHGLECVSDEQGRFELFGWTTEPHIELLAGVRGARLRQPIRVPKGTRDVLLPLPAASQVRD